MSLIDKHSHRIPEGDYIHMCRLMKEMYKTRNQLLVKPDVVGEDFIMTSDALNKCHTWIRSTEALRDAFEEHEKIPKTVKWEFQTIRELKLTGVTTQHMGR